MLIVQKTDLYYFSGTVQNGHLFVPAQGDPVLMIHKNLSRAASESNIGTMMTLALEPKLVIPGQGVVGIEKTCGARKIGLFTISSILSFYDFIKLGG